MASMVENLNLGAVHILGNSASATVALLFARNRPDLVKTLMLEEPRLVSVFLPTTPPSLLDAAKLLWFHPWAFGPMVYFGAAVVRPTTSAFKRGDYEAALKIFSRGVLGAEFDEKLSEARRQQARDNVKTHAALFCYGTMPRILDEDLRKI